MEEGEEADPVGSARDHVAIRGATLDTHFELGQIPVAGGTSYSSIIAVAELDSKLVVCLPLAVWNRRVANRLLAPQGGLIKPIACSLAACDEESRERVAGDVSVRGWLGLLSPALEASIIYDRDAEPDHSFGFGSLGEPLIPDAEALAEVFNERFNTFHTAESAGGGNPPGARDGPVEVAEPDRMAQLEATMLKMQENVQKLLEKKAVSPPTLGARPKASGIRPAPVIGIGAPPGLVREDFAGLDPQVVRSAIESGVSEAHLREMASLMSKQPLRMEDVPRSSAGLRHAGPLDESGDEEEIDGEPLEEEGDSGGPVEKAILQLTKVCQALAKPQMKRGSNIEQILDNTGLTGGTEGSGSVGARKNATALRALKKCLLEQPEYIYQTIEAAMAQDFQSRAARPGEPLQGGSVRGWLETRSRITNQQAHVRWAWAVGAIWDALILGTIKEARARCAVLIAAADQTSIDAGSWLLSGVALLEPAPPFHTFAAHQSPGQQELQHSALLDPRWMELFLSHVKEMDSYQETKRKLSKPNFQAGAASRGDEEKAAKAKAKGKGKGKGKGSQKEAETEASQPTN